MNSSLATVNSQCNGYDPLYMDFLVHAYITIA